MKGGRERSLGQKLRFFFFFPNSSTLNQMLAAKFSFWACSLTKKSSASLHSLQSTCTGTKLLAD